MTDENSVNPFLLKKYPLHDSSSSGVLKYIEKSKRKSSDKNRCSNIIWSMSNETSISDALNTFINNQKAIALDNTRLISDALLTKSENLNSYVDDAIA